MKVYIASDHAGLKLNNYLTNYLNNQNKFQIINYGPKVYDSNDDYPSFCFKVAQSVSSNEALGIHSFGIVIGGSGNGEQIAANKVPYIRAALVWNLNTARLARQHNDANIIAIGERQHSIYDAVQIVETFLLEPFSNDKRHKRRIKQIIDYEIHRK